MSRETSAILRAVLISAKTSKNLKQAIAKIEAMCDKEDLDAVAVSIEQIRQDETEEK
jgi:hypothetical protein